MELQCSLQSNRYGPKQGPHPCTSFSHHQSSKEDSSYGNISLQKIGDPTSTSVRTLNLRGFKGVWHKEELISSNKNLGYLEPYAVDFMSLSVLVFMWQHFEKKFPKITTSEVAKCVYFWNLEKTASLWLAIALKPLGQFQITRYQ